MKQLFLFLALYLTVVNCFPAKEEKDSALYCTYKGIQVKEGETDAAPIGECGTLKCENATLGYLSGKGCGTVNVAITIPGPKCQVVDGDKNKRYPDCCERVHCDGYYEAPTITLTNSDE